MKEFLMREAKNSVCIFTYMYRDAGNFKQFESIVLAGEALPADVEQIRKNLHQGEFFIPEQVGLAPLQERFADISYVPSESDHVWHEVVDLSNIATLGRDQFIAGDKSDLLQKFASVQSWRISASSLYKDAQWGGVAERWRA